MKNDQSHLQKKKSIPKAIYITFFATFISLFITFFILLISNETINLITLGSGNIDIWILISIYLLITRHHLRVIFIDFVYVKMVAKNFEKVIIWLLLLIATMGSITFLISSFGIKILSIFMIIYTLSFLVLGILMLAGRESDPNEEENLNAVLSVLIDLACFSSWIVIFISNEIENYFFLCFVYMVIISGEFLKIFKIPFFNRVKDFKIGVKSLS